MAHSIKNHEQKIYWIAATGDKVAYGETEVGHVTNSGADTFLTFTDRDERDAVLLADYGITAEYDE